MKPFEKIYFTVIQESGISVAWCLSFQVDKTLQSCNRNITQINKSQAFADEYKLTKVVASQPGSRKDTSYMLCLSQKAPKILHTNSNYRGPVFKPSV